MIWNKILFLDITVLHTITVNMFNYQYNILIGVFNVEIFSSYTYLDNVKIIQKLNKYQELHTIRGKQLEFLCIMNKFEEQVCHCILDL